MSLCPVAGLCGSLPCRTACVGFGVALASVPKPSGLNGAQAWHIMAEYSGVLVIWAPALSVPAWPIPCAHGDIFAC